MLPSFTMEYLWLRYNNLIIKCSTLINLAQIINQTYKDHHLPQFQTKACRQLKV